MIAKCSAISHGATAMDYNNLKEKVEVLGFHGLPEDSTTENFWSRMMDFQVMKRQEIQAWKPLKNTALRFELSPENKYTENWTNEDWMNLAKEIINEIDMIDELPPRKGRVNRQLEKTNLRNTQYVVSLHRDSKSGIRHLHILANRVDMNGRTNNDSRIGERAAEAANRISKRRGWDLATDRSIANKEKIHEDAIQILKDMPAFDWAIFITQMQARKYELKTQTDKEGKIKGLSFKKGNSIYKASELGHGRDLTPSKIENTWRKLHKPAERKIEAPISKVAEPKANQNTSVSKVPQLVERGKPLPDFMRWPISYNGTKYNVDIDKPNYTELLSAVKENAAEIGETSNEFIANSMTVALMLFAGYIEAATSMSESLGGGGGASSELSRKDDEDDRKWVRRCARSATRFCIPVYRSFHR